MAMRRACGAVFSICCLIGTAASLSADDDAPLKLRGAEKHTYKSVVDVDLRLHLFTPEGHSADDRRPAIVFFFGGGWRSGSPKQFEQHCRYLASRGMVAATANYRVSSRHGTKAKACVYDGKSAVRWLRTHADELGIDPNRIAAGGGSAGGHVAACTAIIPGFEEPGESTAVSSKPSALVLFNPAVTLAPFDGQEPIPAKRAGNLAERMGTDPINLSPAHHVQGGLPPTIMFFGTDDFLLDGAHYFAERMAQAGNRCEMIEYEGYAHGFFNYGRHDNVPFRKTVAAMDRFLASLGYVEGDPTVDAFLNQLASRSR